MAKEKKPVHKVQMTDGKRQIIQQLLQEYNIETAEDIQDALKDLLGGTIKEMMEAEMDDHLGYQKSERYDSDDYRNGYKTKRVNSSFGSLDIQVPQDRKSTFEPQVVKKRQKDISNIDQKIISMYAKGMTTRQISDTLEDIYGFEASEGFISDVTDKILPQIEEWQHRPLEDIYPVIFIDAIHYSVRDNGIIRKLAAYIILGITCSGHKEVLSIQVGENESAKYWLSVLNELKNRGSSYVPMVFPESRKPFRLLFRIQSIRDALSIRYGTLSNTCLTRTERPLPRILRRFTTLPLKKMAGKLWIV